MARVTAAVASIVWGWNSGQDGCPAAILIVTGLLGWSFGYAVTGTCLITLVVESFVQRVMIGAPMHPQWEYA